MLADELESVARTWSGCALCALADARTQVVFGVSRGELREGSVLVVGGAPGDAEDSAGVPFCGLSGKFLAEEMLAPAGLTNCFVTTMVCCRPPANRDPRVEEIAACQGHLEEIVRLLRPKGILAVGRIAKERVFSLAEEHSIPVTSVIHPVGLLCQEGASSLATKGKLTMEVAKIQRMLSEMRQKPVEPPPGEEDIPFGGPPAPSCQHDFVEAGRIRGRDYERPLKVCSKCGVAE